VDKRWKERERETCTANAATPKSAYGRHQLWGGGLRPTPIWAFGPDMTGDGPPRCRDALDGKTLSLSL